MAQSSLVGPQPQMVSVVEKGDPKDKKKSKQLTTYHRATAKSKDNITVVLIHGFGCTSLEFKAVHELLQKQHPDVNIFNYDRVLFAQNIGESTRDATTLARELHALLENRGVSPSPLVLVGHSYGGLVAQVYASLYPEEIQGLVLMDPAHERQLRCFPQDFAVQFTTLVPAILKTYQKLAWTGILEFLDRWSLFNFPPIFFMQDRERRACARLYSEGSVWNRVARELQGCVETFRDLNNNNKGGEAMRRPFQSIPTALVVARHRTYSPTLFPRAVTQAFVDMHAVSLPRAKLFLASRSDHWIHLQQPRVVLDALGYVLGKTTTTPTNTIK